MYKTSLMKDNEQLSSSLFPFILWPIAIICLFLLILASWRLNHKYTIVSEHKVLQQLDYSVAMPVYVYAPQEITTPQEQEQYIRHSINSYKAEEEATIIDEQVTTTTFKTYKQKVKMEKISNPNVKLYQLADMLFQVYYNNRRVSPLFPLALANVETPGRADHDITWSALFPTKYVSFALLNDFDVTYIAKDPVKYDALMHEWSTRDRGALQMSPTYGTKNSFFNQQMSGTEVEKLQGIEINPLASTWVTGASTNSGDRFKIKDVLLRLSAAAVDAIHDFNSKGITVENDAELIVMLAMYHHRSGVWHVSGAGGWRSTESSLQYVKALTSQDKIDILTQYYKEHSTTLTIDESTALALFNTNWNQYTTSKLEAGYPVKVLYAYIALCNLYGQKL